MAQLILSGTKLTTGSALEQALQLVEARLDDWASNSDAYNAMLLEIFGAQSSDASRALQTSLSGSGLGIRLEILAGDALSGINGAYTSAAPGGGERIYLNGTWLQGARAAEIEAVLLEELGHAIDHQLNGDADTPGDEGEIFSARLRGKQAAPSAATENDQRLISLNGIAVAIEAADTTAPTGSLFPTAPAYAPVARSGLGFVGYFAKPTFADADGDGDLDLFIGERFGNTLFFRNTANPGATALAYDAGATNPFGISDVGFSASPAFADADGDGDLDLFIGNFDGDTLFFRNTGSSTAPAYAAAVTNPFGISSVGLWVTPAFADADADGDLDLFIGDGFGNTHFFRNTTAPGATAPAYAALSTNPFGIRNVGSFARPAFADADGDGDLDLFIGNERGNILFFRNNGSRIAPAYDAASTNPFGISNIGNSASPAFADADADGDLDLFIAYKNGCILFFKNTSATPVAPVASSNSNGSYGIGAAITLTVQFSEVVLITTTGGTPTLQLETGAIDRVATYLSGSGTNTLSFRYIVQAGDTSSDLDQLSANALTLNGGTIKDAAGNNAILTLAAPGAAGSLAVNAALVIDGIAPTTTAAITAIVDNFGIFQGTVASSTTTDDSSLSISGTISAALAAGETVRIYDGVTFLGNATISGNTWIYFDSRILINNQSVSYTAQVADAAGNQSAAGSAYTATVDLTAPTSTAAVSAIADNVGIFQGTMTSGATTDDSSLSISGTISTALATGDTVRVYDGTTYLGNASVTGTTWSYADSRTLTNNQSVSYTAQVADAAGNLSAAGTAYTATLDLIAPTTTAAVTAITDNVGIVQGTVASGATTDDTTPTISGTISAALATGESLRIFNGTTLLGSATVNNTTKTWSFTPTALPNTASTAYAITARVADAAGNLGTASATRSFTLDTTAPSTTASITAVADDIGLIPGNVAASAFTDDTTPTISGTISAALATGETLRIFNGTTLLGSATVNNTTKTWSFTPTALPNTASTAYAITARVADAAGNLGTASATRSFTLDTTAPSTTAAITAITDDFGLIQGNVAAGTTTDDTTPTISGTISAALAAGETVRIYDGTTYLGNASATGSGTTWSYADSRTLINNQSVSYTAQVADAAGNLSAAGTAYTATLDLIAPTTTAVVTAITDNIGIVQGTVASGATTDDTTPTISGTISAALATGESLRIFNGTNLLGSATVSNTTKTWSFTPTALPNTASTAYAITARVADAAGNLGTASATRSFTLDTTAPSTTAAITAITDDFGLIQGNVAAGTTTDDTTPTISGTISAALAAGETVRIYDGTTYLGNASATGSGTTWSYADSRTLINNQSVGYTAQVADAAGNQSAAGTVYTATIDTTATAPSLALVNDTGISNTDGITNVGMVNVGGLETGASWQYSINGGSTWLPGTGTSFFLSSGSYDAGSILARQSDLAGNISANGQLGAITIDTTAPTGSLGRYATAPAYAAPSTNPFGLTGVGFHSRPSFVDIDADGDLDAFIGDYYGNTLFFRNTAASGSTNPAYAVATTNPFGLSDVGSSASPSFVDIDGDGDLDAFIGEKYGNTLFFRNTATSGSTDPAYAAATTATTFGITDVGYVASPSFVDVDGDGDLDAFIGERYGNTLIFRNTAASGSANPAYATAINATTFGLTNVGPYASPCLVDIDGDGDLDAFIGNIKSNDDGSYDDNTFFFRNTATSGSTDPAYAAAINATTFGLTNVGTYASPSLVDIDGDGDLDAFIGNYDGNTLFFRNTAPALGVSSTTANGSYGVGAVINLSLTLSEAVLVTGTPQLQLETGVINRFAVYSGGSGTNTLSFSYTVQAGDTSNDLDLLSANALTLNGGTIKDAAGNNALLTLAAPGSPASLAARKSLVIDTTAPTGSFSSTIATDTGITSTISTGGLTKDNTLGLAGTYADANGVTSVKIYDGVTNLGNASLNSGNWSYTTAALSDGSHFFTAKVIDAAGNALTTSPAVTATVDTTAPTTTAAVTAITDNVGIVTGTIALGATTDDSSLSISGTISVALATGETVRIYDGSTYLGNASVTGTTWSYADSRTLNNNQNVSYTARIADAAGNQSAAGTVYSATVDTTAPTVAITSIGGADKTVSSQTGDATMVGTAEANRLVTIKYGATALGTSTANGTGGFSYTLTAANLTTIGQGTGKSITASQSDAAGNAGISNAFNFALDTLAPTTTIAITAVNDNVGLIQGNVAAGAFTDDTTPTLNGSISAALATGDNLRIFNGTTLLGNATVNNTAKTWSFTPSTALASGFYAITARVADAAGNLATASPAQRFSIDSTANQIIGDANANTLTATTAKDVLTGLGGIDTFKFTALTSSTLANFDRLTDFSIGTDILDGPTAVAAANINKFGAVTALSATSISTLLTAATFLANRAATFSYADPSGISRSFIALNDAAAGYQSSTDAVIEITGYISSLDSLQVI